MSTYSTPNTDDHMSIDGMNGGMNILYIFRALPKTRKWEKPSGPNGSGSSACMEAVCSEQGRQAGIHCRAQPVSGGGTGVRLGRLPLSSNGALACCLLESWQARRFEAGSLPASGRFSRARHGPGARATRLEPGKEPKGGEAIVQSARPCEPCEPCHASWQPLQQAWRTLARLRWRSGTWDWDRDWGSGLPGCITAEEIEIRLRTSQSRSFPSLHFAFRTSRLTPHASCTQHSPRLFSAGPGLQEPNGRPAHHTRTHSLYIA